MSQTKYESQNFNALNDAIDDQHQKSIQKLKEKKSHTFKRYMIYGSLLVVSLSLLILVLGFIYWLLSEKPRNLVTTNEYITNNYQLEKNISQLEKIIERSKQYEKNNTEQKTNGDEIINQEIKEDYYLFRYIDMQSPTIGTVQVTTGLIYNPKDIDFPERQYCYLTLYENEKKVQIDLSNKDKSSNIEIYKYKKAYLNLINEDDFSKAQQYCKFRNF